MAIKIYGPVEFMGLSPPHQPCLVDPIVPVGGIVLGYGKSGVGKSPFSWSLADAVATGESFLGMIPTEPVSVLYVDVDTRWWTIQDRWKKAGYEPKFDIAVGEVFDCLSQMWMHSEVRATLVERHRERNYRLVILSTLAKIHSFSVSAPDAPNLVYSRWQEVFGAECAIAFIHHDKKSSMFGAELDPDTLYHATRESFTGNQQWLDHCTTALHLVRRGGDYAFTLEQVKDQGSKKADPLPVALSKTGVGLAVDTLTGEDYTE